MDKEVHVLKIILSPPTLAYAVEAEPAYFAPSSSNPGQAQAVIRIGDQRYCVSVEALP